MGEDVTGAFLCRVNGNIASSSSEGIPPLRDPYAILEDLNLEFHDANFMTYEKLEPFTDALLTDTLVINGSLKASCLVRNHNSNLEELSLKCNHINDTVMNSFADALTRNHKLLQLLLFVGTVQLSLAHCAQVKRPTKHVSL